MRWEVQQRRQAEREATAPLTSEEIARDAARTRRASGAGHARRSQSSIGPKSTAGDSCRRLRSWVRNLRRVASGTSA